MQSKGVAHTWGVIVLGSEGQGGSLGRKDGDLESVDILQPYQASFQRHNSIDPWKSKTHFPSLIIQAPDGILLSV